MTHKPKILSKSTIAKSRLFRVESMDIEFSNGERRTYERLASDNPGSAVLIVPVLDRHTVLLIREYCAGLDRYELGLPKGRKEAGESILEAANRELKEEAGYGAKSLVHLSSFSLAPAYLQHMTEIVIAENLYPERLPGDEPEPLEVIPWRLDNLDALLRCGECTEARSIAALFMTLEYLKLPGIK